jgi:hypothetical protein
MARIAATKTMTKQIEAIAKIMMAGMGRYGPTMKSIIPMMAKPTAM